MGTLRKAAVAGAVLLVGGSAGAAYTAGSSLQLGSNLASYRSVSYDGPAGIQLRSTSFAVAGGAITRVDLRFSASLATGALGLGRRTVTVSYGPDQTTCLVDSLDLHKASCVLAGLQPEDAQRPRPLTVKVV